MKSNFKETNITNIMHFKEQVNILFFLAQVFPVSSREDANNCKGPGGFLPADPEERNCEYLLYENWITKPNQIT